MKMFYLLMSIKNISSESSEEENWHKGNTYRKSTHANIA
jgi:hypothetical protein